MLDAVNHQIAPHLRYHVPRQWKVCHLIVVFFFPLSLFV